MNSRALLLALALFGAANCTKKDQPSQTALVSQIKQGLVDRDGRVTSYRLKGFTREGEHEAKFEFFYRFPNKMKGELHTPARKTFAFDGQRLFERSDDAKQLLTFTLNLPPHKKQLILTQTFMPFAPEGFRVPLLNQNLSATKISHPKAPEAVELKLAAQEGGKTVGVTYVLRWPSLDFLAKTADGLGRAVEVRVEDEHCDATLKLCFPKVLTQWENGKEVGRTVLEDIAINTALPQDDFTLVAPEGYESLSKEMVESQ